MLCCVENYREKKVFLTVRHGMAHNNSIMKYTKILAELIMHSMQSMLHLPIFINSQLHSGQVMMVYYLRLCEIQQFVNGGQFAHGKYHWFE